MAAALPVNEFDGLTMQEVRNKIRSYRGSRTRQLANLIMALDLQKDHPSTAAANELISRKDKLTVTVDKIVESYTVLLADTYNAKEEEAVTEIEQEHATTVREVLLAVQDRQAAPPAAMAAPAAANERTNRPLAELKPATLTLETSPAMFRDWQECYRSYYTTSRMDRMTAREQQSFLKACMDFDLRTRLVTKADETAPIFTPAAGEGDVMSCMGTLKAIFEKAYPLSRKRHDFMSISQAPGQSMSSYIAANRRRGREADLAALTTDKLYAQLWIVHCRDDFLRRKMQEIKDPSTALLEEVVDTYECIDNSALANKPAAAAATGQQAARQQPRKKAAATPSSADSARFLAIKGKCLRCGATAHAAGANCPYGPSGAGLSCTTCKKKGHVAAVCLGGIRRENLSRGGGKALAKMTAAQADEQLPPPYVEDEVQQVQEQDGQGAYACALSGTNLPTPRVLL